MTYNFKIVLKNSCSTTAHAAGPGFPGYPSPPAAQPAHPPPTSSETDSTQLPAAIEEVGGTPSSSDAPPVSQPSASNSVTNTVSHGHGRTGLFQSQKSLAGVSQPLLEPCQSFAFSARSLSIAASADGEGEDGHENEQQFAEEDSSQTNTHSATFTVGVEEDMDMMEIRQRRLQRFHSQPVSQPTRQNNGGGSGVTSETGQTGNETGETGSGVGVPAASDSTQAESCYSR